MRIRSIKPEFYRSQDIADLDRADRLLFIGLWSYVDDNGVGIDDYRLIASDLFPLDEDQKEVREFVREGLATISRALLLDRYMVDGKSYIYISSWDRHQRVDRPNKTRYPRPSDDYMPPTSGNRSDSGDVATVSRESSESVATVSPPGAVEQWSSEKTFSSETATPSSNGSSKPKSGEPQRDDVDALCTRLRDWMIHNEVKEPTVGKLWKQQARLMLDKDGRDLSKALNLIDWCQQHKFWKSNVLSMASFRDEYDRLALQAREEWRANGKRLKAQSDAIDPDVNPWAGLTYK